MIALYYHYDYSGHITTKQQVTKMDSVQMMNKELGHTKWRFVNVTRFTVNKGKRVMVSADVETLEGKLISTGHIFTEQNFVYF